VPCCWKASSTEESSGSGTFSALSNAVLDVVSRLRPPTVQRMPIDMPHRGNLRSGSSTLRLYRLEPLFFFLVACPFTARMASTCRKCRAQDSFVSGRKRTRADLQQNRALSRLIAGINRNNTGRREEAGGGGGEGTRVAGTRVSGRRVYRCSRFKIAGYRRRLMRLVNRRLCAGRYIRKRYTPARNPRRQSHAHKIAALVAAMDIQCTRYAV